MKNFLTAVMAAATLLAPSQTHASTVNMDFTFTNVSTGATVNGEIDGLTVGGISGSSAGFITSYTETQPIFFASFPPPILIIPFNPPKNVFSVDASRTLTFSLFRGKAAPFGNNG